MRDYGALSPTNATAKDSFIKCEKGKFVLYTIVIILFTTCLTNIDRIYKIFNDTNNVARNDNNIISMESCDILIVGGGISGLSNMHFLSMDNDDMKILLIEQSGRFGGRTSTWNLMYNNTKSINFEGGAMRFRPNNYYINKMLHKMNLCSNEWIPMDNIDNEDGYYFYRNTRSDINDRSYQNYLSNLYNFGDNDVINNNIVTFDNIYDAVRNDIYIENNNGNAPANDLEWELFRKEWTLKGVPIKEWSRKALHSHYYNLSDEHWNYEMESRAFRLRVRDDVLDQLYQGPNIYPEYDYDPIINASNQLFTIKGGYNQLIWKLVDNITHHSDNNVLQLYSKLISIDYNNETNEYRYIVGIQNTMSNDIRYIETNKIILSMDAANLQHILPALTPINNAKTVDMVNSVYSRTNFKANLIYNDPNIFELLQYRKSETSLTYYEYLIEPAWTNDTLTTLHLYSRGDTRAEYAHCLQSLSKPYPYDTELISLNNITSENIIIMSEFLLQELLKEVQLTLNISLPKPIFASYHPLGYNLSHGAAIAEWNFNADKQEILSDNGINKPVSTEDIFISVSDYSPEQGWAYGGIWSAIKTVTTYFGVNDPFINEPQCN